MCGGVWEAKNMSSMEMVKGVLSKRVVGCSHCWDDGAESEGGGGRGVVGLGWGG